MDFTNNNDNDLIKCLEYLEAVLVYKITADDTSIAPGAQASMRELAHSLACTALQAAKKQ